MKDWCTSFPEYWVAWRLPPSWKEFWKVWHKIYIGDCCKDHDNDCNTHSFFKCLRSKRIVGGIAISLGGMFGCLFKYFKV